MNLNRRRTPTPVTTIVPIYAVITAAPSAPAPAGQHEYRGNVMTPNGMIENMVITHSADNFWPLPLWVRPLAIGRIITGLLVNGTAYQWHYVEVPDFGSCTPSGGVSAPAMTLGDSGLIPALQRATRDEWVWIAQRLLEVSP